MTHDEYLAGFRSWAQRTSLAAKLPAPPEVHTTYPTIAWAREQGFDNIDIQRMSSTRLAVIHGFYSEQL